jgi:hypothetical protein
LHDENYIQSSSAEDDREMKPACASRMLIAGNVVAGSVGGSEAGGGLEGDAEVEVEGQRVDTEMPPLPVNSNQRRRPMPASSKRRT